MAQSFIYLWENVITGKKYIGSHQGHINDGYIGSGKYFKRAYDKNPENFKRIILEYTTVENQYLLEQEYLDKFNVAESDLFYNISESAGGGSNWKGLSEEDNIQRRKNMSASAIKNKVSCGDKNPNFGNFGNASFFGGKSHSANTKKQMSKSRRKFQSTLTKEESSKKYGWFIGHSEEALQKMRESTLGQVITENTRKKISNSNKGKIWVNDGKISTKIKPEEFDARIWVKGRMPFTKNTPGTNCKFTNKEIMSIRK